jgi:SAM-dependent methyltransferase
MTIKDFQQAIEIPRKDIILAFCNNCGFIFNSSFDTSLDYYTQGYEDQQGFSPTFLEFLTRLTQRFIDKYDIKNKKIIEIGCGKGDFLNLICELGNNRGIGIDPAWIPDRIKNNPNVTFFKEFYSESHGEIEADCIICRHTLEHIHDTCKFIGIIRKSIKDNKKVVLLFEIPSIIRILKSQAFWDIYYEHCTYLSPGSLARLFRMNDFEVLDIYLEYDDQYLFLEAKPSKDKSNVIHPLEESVVELKTLAEDFVEKINVQLGDWREKLIRFKEENKKVVIWGGGSKCVGFLTHFDEIGLIDHVVDINPYMQGNYIPGIGKRYFSPEFLVDYQPDVVIVMNSVYMEEIRKMLGDRGLEPLLVGL